MVLVSDFDFDAVGSLASMHSPIRCSSQCPGPHDAVALSVGHSGNRAATQRLPGLASRLETKLGMCAIASK